MIERVSLPEGTSCIKVYDTADASLYRLRFHWKRGFFYCPQGRTGNQRTSGNKVYTSRQRTDQCGASSKWDKSVADVLPPKYHPT
jgi:hypothetical protein